MRFRVSRPHKHPKSNILWFRLAVPKDVREKVGKTEIKQSLGTTDSREAEIEHARLTAEWKSRFEELRREISAEQIARAPEIVDRFLKTLSDRQHGDEDIIFYALQKMVAFHLVSAWGPEEYRTRGADRAFGGNPDDDFWEDWSIDEEPDANIVPEAERDFLTARMRVLHRRPESLGAGFRDVIQHVLSSRRWEAVAAHVTLIEAFTETTIPVGSALYEAVAENFVRRLVDHVSYRWDPDVLAVVGPPVTEPAIIPVGPATSTIQPTFQPAGQAPPSNLGKSGGMQLLSAGLQRWKEVKRPGNSAMAEADRAVARFIELFGDKPVAAITDDDIYDYRDFIEAMPANLNLPEIQAAGQNLRDAVADAWEKNPGRKKLSPGSIKKDVGALSAIFSALKGERWIKTNVAAEIPVSGYSKRRKGQVNPRLPLRPFAANEPSLPFGPFGCDHRFARIGGKGPDERAEAEALKLAGGRHQMDMGRIGRAHGDGQVHRGDHSNVALAAQAFERERSNILPCPMQAIGVGKAQRDHDEEILKLATRLLFVLLAETLVGARRRGEWNTAFQDSVYHGAGTSGRVQRIGYRRKLHGHCS